MKCIKYIVLLFGLFILSPVCGQDITSLLSELNQTKDATKQANLKRQIGDIYQDQKVYQQAIKYLNDAYPYFETAKMQQEQKDILRKLASASIALKSYVQATNYLKSLAALESGQTKTEVLLELALLEEEQDNYSEALSFSQEALTLAQAENNLSGIATSQNNIGYLMMQQGKYDEALSHFESALESHKAMKSTGDPNNKSQILLNLGTIYALQGNYRNAREHYRQSLKLEESLRDYSDIAKVNNYIAVSYLKAGNRETALSYAQKGKELAEANNAQQVLLDSYRILSLIYKEKNNIQELEKYNKRSQDLENQLKADKLLAKQEMLDAQLQAEREENKLSILLAEKAKEAAKAEQAILEKDKKAKELALKNQELELSKQKQKVQEEQLKRQKQQQELISQQLLLAEQRALAERRQKEVEIQKQETERQRILAEKLDAERLKNEKELEAAAKDKELQDQKLEQEKALKNFTYLLLGLAGIVVLLLAVVVFNAIRSRKALHQQNMEIHQKNEEIQVQNEELLQTQEEVQAQRDFVDAQNKELANKNNMINASISYAQNIQKAILPMEARFKQYFADHCIIYKPRDLVSGDFYWLDKVRGTTVIAMIDCTGHGVPGAFMSMIGYAIFTEIVSTRKNASPAQILETMHRMIYRSLRQDKAMNNDGMDMNVCTIREIDGEMELRFAGAKLPLYYIQDNELTIIKGTRRSIGGNLVTNKSFEEHRLMLKKGTKLYLFTDGIKDQNNSNLKKFGSGKIKRIITENQDKPLETQKELLLKALEAHQEKEPQRDDISFVGVTL